MKKQGFLTTMFLPLIIIVFTLVMAIGAGVGGYSEVYAIWISYSIMLATAVVLMVQLYKARK